MAKLYKMVNGERIELSAEETKAREAEEKAWADGEKDRNLEHLDKVCSFRYVRRNRLLWCVRCYYEFRYENL